MSHTPRSTSLELKNRYKGRADGNAYRLALQFLLEKLDRNVPGLKLIVADEAKEEQVYAQKMLMGMQQWQWSGEVPARKLTTVIDSLHFLRSDTNPGVQLADLVAYVLQKVRRGANHLDAQTSLEAMRDTIRDRLSTWREPWPRRRHPAHRIAKCHLEVALPPVDSAA